MLILLDFRDGRARRGVHFIFFSNFLVAFQSLDVLAGLLNDGTAWTVKIAVQTLAGAYPLLFRRMCVTRQDLLDPPGANVFNPFLHPLSI